MSLHAHIVHAVGGMALKAIVLQIVHACCTSDDPALKAKALAKLPHLPQVRAEPKQLTVQAKRLQQKKNKKLLKSTQKQASL